MSTAQNVVHILGPDFHLVVIEVGTAIGIVVRIPNDELGFFLWPILVKVGDMRVHLFGDFCHQIGSSLGSLVIMNDKVIGFDTLPVQLRMIIGLRLRPGKFNQYETKR